MSEEEEEARRRVGRLYDIADTIPHQGPDFNPISNNTVLRK